MKWRIPALDPACVPVAPANHHPRALLACWPAGLLPPCCERPARWGRTRGEEGYLRTAGCGGVRPGPLRGTPPCPATPRRTRVGATPEKLPTAALSSPTAAYDAARRPRAADSRVLGISGGDPAFFRASYSSETANVTDVLVRTTQVKWTVLAVRLGHVWAPRLSLYTCTLAVPCGRGGVSQHVKAC